MNKGKYYILPDGVKVEKVNVEMFKAGDGFAYQDERLTEYNVAIGSICECGNFIEGKSYTACDDCRLTNREKRYKALEEVGWDGETPLTIFMEDQYFFYEDEIDSYCEENDVKVEDLQLVLCEPNSPLYFDIEDYFYDTMPEDSSIHDYTSENTKYSAKDIEEIINNFLTGLPTISWCEGNKRVTVKLGE
jgi:hypothetical protein